MRVLVIEDDNKIASFVVNGLKQTGFAVDHAADGEKGLALAGAVILFGLLYLLLAATLQRKDR